MNISDYIQGIVNALYGEFGTTCKIYTESVNQSLDYPCFLVKCLNPTQGIDLGTRYVKMLQMAVQYIPSGVTGTNAECNGICDRLFNALEDITVGGRIHHGTEMQGTTTDGVLTFTVDYRAFMLKEQTQTDMHDISVDVNAE